MRRLALASLVAVAALAGCDRVPLDGGRSELLLADSDLDVVFLTPDLRVRFVPTGPSGAVALRIRDKDILFDSTDGSFLYERTLLRGLNAYPYELIDSQGGVLRDTFYAVFLPFARSPLVNAEVGVSRADAAAVPFSDDRALVTGGVGVDGALAAAAVLRTTGGTVVAEETDLLRPRAGHTATAIPQGTLLMGGGQRGLPEIGAEFVREPEFIDAGGIARPVAVADDALPARAGHVAKATTLGGETYVTLFGGRTPTQSGTALSGTVDVYRVVPEGPTVRLERLTPAGGAGGFARVRGPALAETGPSSAVVTGLDADGRGVTLAFEWRPAASGALPFSISVTEVSGPRIARADAHALPVGTGLALFSGGRDANDDPVGTLELYAAGARRTFRVPPSVALSVPRADHVATIFGGSRIVVSGGRPSSGAPLVSREAFSF